MRFDSDFKLTLDESTTAMDIRPVGHALRRFTTSLQGAATSLVLDLEFHGLPPTIEPNPDITTAIPYAGSMTTNRVITFRDLETVQRRHQVGRQTALNAWRGLQAIARDEIPASSLGAERDFANLVVLQTELLSTKEPQPGVLGLSPEDISHLAATILLHRSTVTGLEQSEAGVLFALAARDVRLPANPQPDPETHALRLWKDGLFGPNWPIEEMPVRHAIITLLQQAGVKYGHEIDNAIKQSPATFGLPGTIPEIRGTQRLIGSRDKRAAWVQHRIASQFHIADARARQSNPT